MVKNGVNLEEPVETWRNIEETYRKGQLSSWPHRTCTLSVIVLYSVITLVGEKRLRAENVWSHAHGKTNRAEIGRFRPALVILKMSRLINKRCLEKLILLDERQSVWSGCSNSTLLIFYLR